MAEVSADQMPDGRLIGRMIVVLDPDTDADRDSHTTANADAHPDVRTDADPHFGADVN